MYFWKAQIHVWILWAIFFFAYIAWPILRDIISIIGGWIGRLFPVDPDIEDTHSGSRTYEEFQGKWRESIYERDAETDRDNAEFEYAEPPKPPPLSLRERHLATLGLTRAASARDIKSAYRRMAKQFHPDRFASSQHSDKDRQKASTKMARINAAYDWLTA